MRVVLYYNIIFLKQLQMLARVYKRTKRPKLPNLKANSKRTRKLRQMVQKLLQQQCASVCVWGGAGWGVGGGGGGSISKYSN